MVQQTVTAQEKVIARLEGVIEHQLVRQGTSGDGAEDSTTRRLWRGRHEVSSREATEIDHVSEVETREPAEASTIPPHDGITLGRSEDVPAPARIVNNGVASTTAVCHDEDEMRSLRLQLRTAGARVLVCAVAVVRDVVLAMNALESRALFSSCAQFCCLVCIVRCDDVLCAGVGAATQGFLN